MHAPAWTDDGSFQFIFLLIAQSSTKLSIPARSTQGQQVGDGKELEKEGSGVAG
jgi:hypothetical protein